ncbi:hypothetical protein [Cryobacterium sp. GrIS_2_6]|uniref:hypothetical protein n=1 Tax=Cryobacterium sp. GrIS_2_6 TaxID=3162785 RepID=UPI002DFF5C33|nr:hypothetical protein [Cryobacterium psychrotolerans]MEC5149289.1 hypothetical protein [Cryobacterium psychrotolerans]MEC5149368.1 hypothetical protein [Cryobacterium psychrotolerans]
MSETGNTKSSISPSGNTVPSITNAKSLEIKLGDIVVTAGSKTQRVVDGISRGEVHGTRLDRGNVAHSRWLNPDKLTILGSVL